MSRARRPRGRLFALGLLAAILALAFVVPPARVDAWVSGQFNGAQESLLFSLTNKARAAVGVAPLKFNSQLRSLARWRSKDMADRQYFSHEIPPDGRMVFAYMDQRGFKYVLAGENIGWNNAPDGQATQLIQRMFMDSPGHRANLLYKKWDSMGIGAFKGYDGAIRYTVLFMQSKGRIGQVEGGFAAIPAPPANPATPAILARGASLADVPYAAVAAAVGGPGTGGPMTPPAGTGAAAVESTALEPEAALAMLVPRDHPRDLSRDLPRG